MTQHMTTEALRTLRATRKSGQTLKQRDAPTYPGLDAVKSPQVAGAGQQGISWAYEANAGQASVQYPPNTEPDARYRPGAGMHAYSNPAVDSIPADYD